MMTGRYGSLTIDPPAPAPTAATFMPTGPQLGVDHRGLSSRRWENIRHTVPYRPR